LSSQWWKTRNDRTTRISWGERWQEHEEVEYMTDNS
jgi:hypothetical protein